jgi:hypothetical protein
VAAVVGAKVDGGEAVVVAGRLNWVGRGLNGIRGAC